MTLVSLHFLLGKTEKERVRKNGKEKEEGRIVHSPAYKLGQRSPGLTRLLIIMEYDEGFGSQPLRWKEFMRIERRWVLGSELNSSKIDVFLLRFP